MDIAAGRTSRSAELSFDRSADDTLIVSYDDLIIQFLALKAVALKCATRLYDALSPKNVALANEMTFFGPEKSWTKGEQD